MSPEYVLIFIIFALGILAKSNLLPIAALILFTLKLLSFKAAFPILEDKGLEIGLLFLILSVLTPLITDPSALSDLIKLFKSPLGLLALLGGLLATKLNGMGLDLLESKPELIVGMVLGSLIGIAFLGGIPVGPLMAGGITAFFFKIFQVLFS